MTHGLFLASGSSIDLTSCMVDILDSFNMATTSCDDGHSDIGQPPAATDLEISSPGSGHPVKGDSAGLVLQHQLECGSEVSSVDSSSHTCLTSDSGVNDLDRHSIWRNSSSSSGSSHQSALSLISSGDLHDQFPRHSSSSTAALSLVLEGSGSKTHFIMDEILQTEKNYVEDLRQICQVCVELLKLLIANRA